MMLNEVISNRKNTSRTHATKEVWTIKRESEQNNPLMCEKFETINWENLHIAYNRTDGGEVCNCIK